ncbi:MAG: ImmA/IrrE family metallo-endopeptidase [Bacteroidia bacterium]|nr:ImmA/IrrE family metallo-endopeptidase [Bacteroidia bacterium]
MDTILRKEAATFRERNGIGSTEPITLKSLLIKLNVLTVYKPLSGKFSGMALLASDKRFMLVNSDHPIGKQNFTICHELYHLFIQDEFSSVQCITGRFDKKADRNEYNADVFAAYLLMPEDGILELIPNEELKGKNKVSLETLLRIEHYYSCSRLALLYRLSSMNLIGPEKFQQFKFNVIQSAAQYGYSNELYKQGNQDEIIGDYGQLAKRLFEVEKISESHYLELMEDIGKNVTKEDSNEWEF